MLRYHMESIEEYFDLGEHPNNLPSDYCRSCPGWTGRILSHSVKFRLSSCWDSACRPALPTRTRIILQKVETTEEKPKRVEKSS